MEVLCYCWRCWEVGGMKDVLGGGMNGGGIKKLGKVLMLLSIMVVLGGLVR